MNYKLVDYWLIKESRVLNSEDLKYYCIWKKEKSDEVKVKKIFCFCKSICLIKDVYICNV